MTEQTEQLHTDGVVGDYFMIEGHFLSTRSADAYKAIDRSRGTPIFLWMLRQPLPLQSDVVQQFLERMFVIDQIEPRVSDMAAYGVDAQGTGFGVFPVLDGHSVAGGNVERGESERRIIACVKLIDQLHQKKVVCGDLCEASFWLNRSGDVRLLGIMGAFGVAGPAAAPPVDTLPYLAPEQRGGAISDPRSDVFALGVLSYRLLTRNFPYGTGTEARYDHKNIPPISSFLSIPPIWAQEVLMRCLDPDPAQRYANAGAVVQAISDARNRALSDASMPAKVQSRSVIPNNRGADGQVTQFRQIETPAVQTAPEDSPVTPKRVVLLSAGLLLVVGFVFYREFLVKPSSPQRTELREELLQHRGAVSDESLREAIDVITVDDAALTEKQKQLESIVNSDDPIAHDILVKSALQAESPEWRELSETAIINRARRLGLMRSAEQVRQLLRRSGSTGIAPGYEALLKLLNNALPKEAREGLLRQAYEKNPKGTLRLAVALALDLGELKEFQPVLAQLVGDSLGLENANEYSSLALVLADRDLSLVFSEDVIQLRAEIPDKDLLWLLKILAERDDINVRAISSAAVERGVISPIRSVFLTLIRDRDDLSPELLSSLSRAAGGILKKEDIGSYGRWYDVEAERVLLAILADVQDPIILKEALDTLLARTVVVEPTASLLNWVRDNYWDQRAEFARAIGILGNLAILPKESLDEVFTSLDKFMRDSDLIDILIETGQPDVVQKVVNKYPDLLGLGTKLELLSNKDKNIRLVAIGSLKDLNDIGALKIIIDHYEREREPDVKQKYRDTFWAIREREQQKGG